MSLVGSRIGNIRVLEALGKGGMGEVYVGLDETLARRVALKAIRGERRMDPAARARFLREARILSQLEHPNICRVYDWVEHAGTELLVLEFIEGETLGRAIERGIEHRRKLEIAIDVARVLAAAHAAGIIHRDLKPDNVMIAHDGTVKVLDFGLARSSAAAPAAPSESPRDVRGTDAAAGDAHPAPAGSPPHEELDASRTSHAPPTLAHDLTEALPSDGDLRTVAGTLVGTPAYMSPEQARGEPATAASDMYSFGLLLRALFGGLALAERGFDIESLRRRAQGDERRPLTGVPSDLASLIARLETPATAARPTAAEALGRLEWIRAKPARRLRRLAIGTVLAAAAIFALKYTLDVRRERGIAVEARRVAEQRREQAEELISFMLGDVRGKLEPLGKLELLDDVGRKALDYFAAVPEAELSDVELARRAKALYQIGEVRIKQGDLASAMEAFEQAVALGEGLVARDPENTEWLWTLAQSHFWVGNGRWNEGQLAPALASFESYRDLSRRLAEKDRANLDWRMEVAYGEFNLATVLEAQGALEPARERLEACVAIVEELLRAAPDRDDWRLELAKGHLQAGRLSESLGELEAALAHHRTNLEIVQGLLVEDPEHAGWLEQLAMAHGDLGTVLEHRGAWREARAHRESYLGITEDLAARDPTNQWWRGIVAVGQSNLGRLLALEGDTRKGLELLRSATDTLVRLGGDEAGLGQWGGELGRSRLSLGQVRAAVGDLPRAAAEAEAAAGVLVPLVEARPRDVQPRVALSECDLLRGDVLAKMGRADEARAARERAIEILSAVAPDSRDGRLLAPLARSLLLLGREQEARPILARLAEQGYADPYLADLTDTEKR